MRDFKNSDKRAGFHCEDVNAFQVAYKPIQSGIFQIFLTREIVEAEQFIPAIQVLNAATENDLVEIFLSTPGGSLDATDTFLNELRKCEARVVVHASGGVHSAGTVILLNSNEFTLSENFNALIHNGSCGAWGKYNEFKAQSKHSEAYMEKVMRNTYEGFLTDEEIDDLIDGKDFWLDAEEFVARWNRRNDLLEQAAADVLEAMQNMREEEDAPPPKPARKRKKAD